MTNAKNRPAAPGVPLSHGVKKGDFVTVTYLGATVIGKVIRVTKANGTAVTVDLSGHPDEDVGYVDFLVIG